MVKLETCFIIYFDIFNPFHNFGSEEVIKG